MEPRARASIMKPGALVLALAMAAAACSSTGASDHGGAGDVVLSAKYMRHHLTGLPPLGARPSSPQPTGRCLINWLSGPVTYAVYPDGLVIWQRWTHAGAPRIIPKGANARTTAFVQQRLTPRGARLLRSQIRASGRIRRFRPDLLPASAWADRTIRPYIPTHYNIAHDHGDPRPSWMPPPAGAALAHYTGFLRHAYQLITLNQAITLAHAFFKAGITPAEHWSGGLLAYHNLNGNPNVDGGLNMWPRLPGANLRSNC